MDSLLSRPRAVRILHQVESHAVGAVFRVLLAADARWGSGVEETEPLDLPALDWPVPRDTPVSSRFGLRVHPVHGQARFHHGVDLAVPVGESVYVAAEGWVLRAREDSLNGKFVVVFHPESGLRTAYCHLDRMDVRVGSFLERGDVLGLSGSTGRVTGPHLHFGIWRGRTSLDPLHLLRPG